MDVNLNKLVFSFAGSAQSGSNIISLSKVLKYRNLFVRSFQYLTSCTLKENALIL
jgi:hypothetical protein